MLVFDAALAARAKKWAEHMAKTNNFAHDYSHNLGENLYMSMSTKNVKPTKSEGCKVADKNWYVTLTCPIETGKCHCREDFLRAQHDLCSFTTIGHRTGSFY